MAATARPILTDVKIAAATVLGVAPARPRDVLAGQPLTVALELAAEGGVVEVSGRLAGSHERWTTHLTIPPITAREGLLALPLGALYGREAIADHEMSGSRDDERLTQIALRHRIASRMTSLVAVSEEPTVDPNAPSRRVIVPVEVPAYLSAEAVGLGSPALMFLCREDEAFQRIEMDDRPATSRRGWLSRLMGRSLPDEPEEMAAFLRRRAFPIAARVLAVNEDLIIIELETPSGRFMRPSGVVIVSRDGRELGTGTIEEALSSPVGPHAKGLVLRPCDPRLDELDLPRRGRGHDDAGRDRVTETDSDFARARDGDTRAFASWMTRVESWPLRASLRRFARAIDVESALQETFLRMWVAAQDLRRTITGENASLRFALSVARNVALEEVRRARLSHLVALDDLDKELEPSIDPKPIADTGVFRAIKACVEQLRGRPREALLARLARGHELHDRDLATSLGLTVNTFLQNVVRARKAVAACLEGKGL